MNFEEASRPSNNISLTTKTVGTAAGYSSTQLINQAKVKRNLTMKHKLLAKAIK